jgi:iron(III) transport system substrate-binding protein
MIPMRSPFASGSPLLLAPALLTVFAAAGCGGSEEGDAPPVRVYVALDQEHSESLVRRFEEQSGVDVEADYDTEASKTVGLVNRLLEEQERPRADVFWNNELAHTVRLGQKGVLTPYVSPNAAAIPDQFKAADGLWTGFAARARVIIVNTDDLGTDPAGWPQTLEDFADPKWKGRCAIAKPLTGTTLTHFVALHETMGEEKFSAWLDALEANDVIWLQSNGATKNEVAESGNGIDFALTDTDDFHVALTKGQPVACVFPDQGEGQRGTMLIPNSVAMIQGGPNPEGAKRLIDFIVSEEVEGLLAAAKSAQIPVRASVKGPESNWIKGIGDFRPMQWDAEAVASRLAELTGRFARRYGGGK